MKPKIYIDGKEGTTGLQIYDRLGPRSDIDLLAIDDDKRKSLSERKRLLNAADIVFLCLPDDVAREAVSMIENERTRVIDASTAHRTVPGWIYGFPELSEHQRTMIKSARFVANPGCHATGFIAIVYPLITLGILPKDYPLTCFSLTGYSGGGKKMIADYEECKSESMSAPGIYGLNLSHKHLPEMTAIAGLAQAPAFCPIVNDYYKGMATAVTLFNDRLLAPETSEGIRQQFADYYSGQRFITVAPELGSGTLYSNWGTGTNDLEITVSGNDTQTLIIARFDNLGKGASGAAIQNMNIMLGLREEEGLI